MSHPPVLTPPRGHRDPADSPAVSPANTATSSADPEPGPASDPASDPAASAVQAEPGAGPHDAELGAPTHGPELGARIHAADPGAPELDPEALARDAADRVLLEGCIAGDRRAWAAFVERFSRYVWFMVRATGNRYGVRFGDETCADLHNDLFVALLEDDRRRLRQYTGRNGCSVRAWVRIITVRRTIDALRKLRPERSIDADAEADGPDRLTPVDQAPSVLERLLVRESDARHGHLAALIDQLPAADRQLLDLLFTQKLSVPEAAAALGIRHGALYTRKNRIINRLRGLALRAGLLEGPAGNGDAPRDPDNDASRSDAPKSIAPHNRTPRPVTSP